MNKLEISFAEPASVINVGTQASSLIQDTYKITQSEAVRNRLEVTGEELELIEALRKGDEVAFGTLIDRYHSRLLRLAMTFVPSEAVAEEVVQETWMNVLESINRFEGRSSLTTWIFKILTNRAKTRGIQERRYVSLTDLGNQNDEEEDYEIGPGKFNKSGPLGDHWAVAPSSWEKMTPERWLLSKECGEQIEEAIRRLPEAQQKVIILRDVEGMKATEVCALLQITESHLRVLLHRARGKVRTFLDAYLEGRSSKSTTPTPMRVTWPARVAIASAV